MKEGPQHQREAYPPAAVVSVDAPIRLELVVVQVGHHFPQLADPARFAALLAGRAAATRKATPQPNE